MVSFSEILDSRVVIVGDKPTKTRLLKETLACAGYKHVSALRDHRAVSKLHLVTPIDLVVVQADEPGPATVEVVDSLQQVEAAVPMPFLLVASPLAKDVVGLPLAVKDVITLPMGRAEVALRVRNLLELRLLDNKLRQTLQEMEQTIFQRTAELQAQAASYRYLTELASDWFWEQDVSGRFVKASGPVLEMFGLTPDLQANATWNQSERETLRGRISSNEAFLDLPVSRIDDNGLQRTYLVSGEPIFNRRCELTGYRGVGLERRESLIASNVLTSLRAALTH
jgi:PAS domain-containing protein